MSELWEISMVRAFMVALVLLGATSSLWLTESMTSRVVRQQQLNA
jgi:hypothetical protein